MPLIVMFIVLPRVKYVRIHILPQRQRGNAREVVLWCCISPYDRLCNIPRKDNTNQSQCKV